MEPPPAAEPSEQWRLLRVDGMQSIFSTSIALFWLVVCLAPVLAAQDSTPPEPAREILTTEQAVAEAIAHNLDLLAARFDIDVAKAAVLTARLRPNPELSLTADHLDILGAGFDLNNGAGPPEYASGVEYTIEGGGKRKQRTEAAGAAVPVAELQFLDAVRLTVLDVETACVDALRARDDLELARRNYAAQQRIVEINTARLAAGDIAELELIRSRLEALSYQNDLRRAGLALHSALVRVQKLLGRPQPGAGFRIGGELRNDPHVPELSQVRRLALAQRPDLRALRHDLERAEAEISSQVAQGKIDFTVGAEYRRQQGINGTGNSLGFSLGIPLPVFDRNQGEIERARREREQVRARIRALVVAINSEVAGAYQELLTARDLFTAVQGKMVSEARDVLDITQYSYERGDASLLQLIDAQRAFNDTMLTYNEARAAYARALYYLDAVSARRTKP